MAQIARSIARELGLDEDLTEALALAHDLGHPPFGHAGEEALNLAMKPFGGFDHNAQSLRVVTLLESRYAGWDGLNLTWETLEGLAKHNGPLRHPPAYIAEYNDRHRLELATHASAEAQVAALADDVAYHSHDLDDGLRARLFGPEEICASAGGGRGAGGGAAVQPRRAAAAAAARDDPAGDRRDGHRPDRRDAPAPGQAGRRATPMRCAGRSRRWWRSVAPMAEANQVIKDFLHARMYRHWRVNRMTTKARVLTDGAVPSAARGYRRCCRMTGARGPARRARSARRRRWRLHCGHDRPLCDGRAPAADRPVGERVMKGAMQRSELASAHCRQALRRGMGRMRVMTHARHLRAMRDTVLRALRTVVADLPDDVAARVEVTPARDPAHGDMATNAALVAAKAARQPPAKLAAAIVEQLQRAPGIARGERRRPGLRQPAPRAAMLSARCCRTSCARGEAYGDSSIGNGTRVNVEYVSANPTGPMHIGHCRGAVVGDALANLLAKAGYDVTKEYYINDAGAQVTALAWAAYWRYLQAIGTPLSEADFADEVPGGLQYRGDYLIPIGERSRNSTAPRWRCRTAASPRRKSGSTSCATSPSRR